MTHKEQRDSYPLAAQPACVLSMPPSFYASVDRDSPWVSFDPFLRAELRAIYRSVRFILLALFAMLTNPRPSSGECPEGSALHWSQALDRTIQSQSQDPVRTRQGVERGEQRRWCHPQDVKPKKRSSAPEAVSGGRSCVVAFFSKTGECCVHSKAGRSPAAENTHVSGVRWAGAALLVEDNDCDLLC